MMETFICYLSLTDSSIYEIKDLARNNEQKKENLNQIFNILKCVNKKIQFYFGFTFVLMAFYWYSVACFCAVYRNTQMNDCGLSFVSGLCSPFIIYLFPAILRVIALICKNLCCIYKLSDLIPIFWLLINTYNFIFVNIDRIIIRVELMLISLGWLFVNSIEYINNLAYIILFLIIITNFIY